MKRLLAVSFVALLMVAVLVPDKAWARGGHGHYRGHHHHSYFSIGLGFGHPGYFHWPYYGRYYGPWAYYGSYGWGYRPYVYVRSGGAQVPPGGIDLNVKPKKNTEVWIDGSYVGFVKSFDGYPDYLWLPKGDYKLVLFNPGYRTVERDVTIYPGVVIDFRLRLAPGPSTPPQELAPEQPEKPAPAAFPGIRELPSTRVADAARARVQLSDVPGETGRLHLAVTPSDASVYLDGRFVGRGQEITESERGLMIEPGEHLLEVVRPGHEPQTLAFRAAAGETVELAVRLASDKG